MKTAERRNAILKLLQNAEEPVAARKLAERYGVSRQVIVQDMAVIRAYTPGIISTTKGYVMEQEPRCVREFKVRHKQSDAAKELNLMIKSNPAYQNCYVSGAKNIAPLKTIVENFTKNANISRTNAAYAAANKKVSYSQNGPVVVSKWNPRKVSVKK